MLINVCVVWVRTMTDKATTARHSTSTSWRRHQHSSLTPTSSIPISSHTAPSTTSEHTSISSICTHAHNDMNSNQLPFLSLHTTSRVVITHLYIFGFSYGDMQYSLMRNLTSAVSNFTSFDEGILHCGPETGNIWDFVHWHSSRPFLQNLQAFPQNIIHTRFGLSFHRFLRYEK